MISPFKDSFKVTSKRGYRILEGKKEYHGGLDLVALGDDISVYCVADGVVDATPYEANGFGYYVRQLLPDGRRIYYGHMKSNICVKPGEKITKGTKLGTMGNSGRSTGAHLHIELRVKGTSKESLDICSFLGIPNEIGQYAMESVMDKEKHMLEEKIYNSLEEVPDNWGNSEPRTTIKKLIDIGVLKGTGTGLALSHETLRILMLLYRGGGFDRALKNAKFQPVFKD